MATGLASKGPGHDQRKCRFLVPNPSYDRSRIPEGVDRARLPLFHCLYKGADHPLITTMVKCRYCRTVGLWYQPTDDSPDAQLAPESEARPGVSPAGFREGQTISARPAPPGPA